MGLTGVNIFRDKNDLDLVKTMALYTGASKNPIKGGKLMKQLVERAPDPDSVTTGGIIERIKPYMVKNLGRSMVNKQIESIRNLVELARAGMQFLPSDRITVEKALSLFSRD